MGESTDNAEIEARVEGKALNASASVNGLESGEQDAGCEVLTLNPLQDDRWEEWVGELRIESVFYGAQWARVLADTYGYTSEYLAAVDERGACTGLLPLMEVNSFLTGRRGIALPFTDECEPAAEDGEMFRPLFEQAFAIGASRGWKYIELRGGRSVLPEAEASQRFYVHEIDLLPDEAALFGSLKSPVRRAIRKAEKSGLTIELSQDLAAMEQFYKLHCKTRRKHGLPPQPFSFFANIHRHLIAPGRGDAAFPQHPITPSLHPSERGGFIALARTGTKPVAANVFVHSGKQAIYKFGASDEALQELRGSDLAMWAGLKYYASRGFARLNLGRTSMGQDGLRRFKLGWGARERILEYLKYDVRKRQFVRSGDEAFGWYNRVFALMPMSCSRLAGRLLYRHIA